jgi:hypothetical protein
MFQYGSDVLIQYLTSKQVCFSMKKCGYLPINDEIHQPHDQIILHALNIS